MPTLHLIVDEVVPVDKLRFRVRIWRFDRSSRIPLTHLSNPRPSDSSSESRSTFSCEEFPCVSRALG
jgi:hypothetical protein